MMAKGLVLYEIQGDTYTYRQEIKDVGGRWYPEAQKWCIAIKDDPAHRKAIFPFLEAFGLTLVRLGPV